MNKTQVIEHVATDTGLSRREAAAAVDSVVRTIESALSRGDDVSFTGFGRFTVAERRARAGVNPRTGERVHISAARRPRFTAGTRLRESVSR